MFCMVLSRMSINEVTCGQRHSGMNEERSIQIWIIRANLSAASQMMNFFSSSSSEPYKTDHAVSDSRIVSMNPSKTKSINHSTPQGLQLTQLRLSHEKYMDEAQARVKALEDEIEVLQRERQAQVASNTPPAGSEKKSSSWWRWS